VRSIACLLLLSGIAIADEPKPLNWNPTERPPAKVKPDAPKPVPVEKLESSARRGVEYLLANQNRDGSWGTPSLKGGVPIYAGIGTLKSYGTATTALCVAGLIEMGGDNPDVIKAIERGEQSLFETLPQEKRDDPTLINNVWAHAYGIQALVRMHGRLPNDKARQEKIVGHIKQQMAKLEKYESAQGGWGYYDFDGNTQRPDSSSTSFVNAAVLVALAEAKAIGVEPPAKILKRGIQMTQFQRQKDGSYLYGTYMWSRPTHEINQKAGSLGRSQACNYALRLWGDKAITDDVLIEWLDRMISRNGWLDVGRKKPVPHESFFAVAGYFFYFGHYYAAASIPMLPEAKRPFYQDHLASIIIELQEADGSWFDYPLYDYHKGYGTGFALLTLAKCKKKVAPPPLP
jgi:squalene cyclase